MELLLARVCDQRNRQRSCRNLPSISPTRITGYLTCFLRARRVLSGVESDMSVHCEVITLRPHSSYTTDKMTEEEEQDTWTLSAHFHVTVPLNCGVTPNPSSFGVRAEKTLLELCSGFLTLHRCVVRQKKTEDEESLNDALQRHHTSQPKRFKLQHKHRIAENSNYSGQENYHQGHITDRNDLTINLIVAFCWPQEPRLCHGPTEPS